MTVRIGINGFGRIGRLVVRALQEHPELDLVHVNEAHAEAATSAHLLEFDTVHGRFEADIASADDTITLNGATITHTLARHSGGRALGRSRGSIWCWSARAGSAPQSYSSPTSTVGWPR